MRFTNPYLRLMRLHQPVGIWLLLWPCLWSLALAGEGRLWIYALFIAGAVIMRGAGCVVNDMLDRDFDRQVERTKNRPLAGGELSMRQAALFLVGLLFAAAVIAFSLGATVALWSAASLPLVASYPLMKRITWWPQLFLGLTFNWGALLGWVAARGEIGAPAIILYLACVFWTLGYDTIYAHQDTQDDAKIGVRSTALYFGAHTKRAVAACYILFAVGLAALVWPHHVALMVVALAAAQLGWQVYELDLNMPASCRKIFVSNRWFGWLPCIAIIVMP